MLRLGLGLGLGVGLELTLTLTRTRACHAPLTLRHRKRRGASQSAAASRDGRKHASPPSSEAHSSPSSPPPPHASPPSSTRLELRSPRASAASRSAARRLHGLEPRPCHTSCAVGDWITNELNELSDAALRATCTAPWQR